ncbi:MAG: hypothetical protein ABJC89_21490 [Acidobacteriota bacterium]
MVHLRRWPGRTIAILAATIALGPVAAAAQATIIDLHDLSPRQVQSGAFSLTSPEDLQIEAVGAQSANGWGQFTWVTSMLQGAQRTNATTPWTGNAWILDLAARTVVWDLSTAPTTGGSGSTRTFTGTVRLPAGSYAAYYAAFPDGEYWSDDDKGSEAKKWHWFGDQPVSDFKLRVRGNAQRMSSTDAARATQPSAGSAIVSLRGTESQQYQQAGFVLARPTEVEVAAVGEAREDGEFDSGWIINADTLAKVWKMTWRDSAAAGGAEKNRVARVTRTLPAGRYAAFYATDDSHDPSGWNAQPPADPDAWGLTITVRDAAARAAVKSVNYELVPANATIVALTRIGNGVSRTQGFTLTRPMDVRIYAIGEGREGRMNDYGWITNASTRARVWEMRYANTEPAGGAPKNRLVDTTLHLDTGSYIVHYLTDDSHAAGEWNAPAPADGRHWGITVLSARGPLVPGATAPYEAKADPSIVAQLTEIGSDDQASKRFTLDRETALRVYAVGEGTRREMVDYGWIEEAKGGRRVWEMKYSLTEHAGGAAKNRRFDGTVTLPAGEYILRYESDDSHAFGDWNGAPPDDPDAWGITVSRVRR